MRQKVIDAVAKLIQDGRVFTSFDITQALRADGSIVRHPEVRFIVNGLWMSQDPVFAGMERDQITIAQIDEPVLAYHAAGQDPNDHPNAVKPVVDDDGLPTVGAGFADPLGRTVTQTPPTGPSATPTAGAKVTLQVEGQGRLNVPTDLIRDVLGAKPGDSVVVTVDQGSLKMVNANTVNIGDDTDQHIYTVTVRGNARLAPELVAALRAGRRRHRHRREVRLPVLRPPAGAVQAHEGGHRPADPAEGGVA